MVAVAGAAVAADPRLPARLGVAVAPGAGPAEVSARLWDRWLGGATFFQEPGYPYLVGLTYWLAGPQVWAVFAWQLALGALGVLLVHALARRLHSHTAAAAAGALAVLAPIPLFYEVVLLRDALVVFATLGLALLMAWTVEGPRRRWLLLGLAFGAAAALKQTFLALPLLMGAWRLATVPAPWRDRLAAAGLLLAGLAAALSPVVVRNLLVGVPALAMNGSAAAQLPVNHTAGAGVFAVRVDPGYVQALLASDGSPLRALLAAARTHPDAWSLVALELRKLAWTWHGYEAPNNVDFYLFRQAAPLLELLPARLVVLAPLAAIGLWRGAARAWPLLLAMATCLAGLVAATVLARYRAPLLAILLPLAGIGAVRLAGWVRQRRWRPLAAAALLTAPYLAWATGSPPGLEPAARAAEYGRSAEWFARQSPALGALYLEEALRLAPGNGPWEQRLGELLREAGDAEGALPHLEAAQRLGQSPTAPGGLGRPQGETP